MDALKKIKGHSCNSVQRNVLNNINITNVRQQNVLI